MTRFVRNLPGEFLTSGEVARELGASRSYLVHLERSLPEAHLGPTHSVQYGQRRLKLYTPERVEQIRRYLEMHKPTRGPRRIWTPVELADRNTRLTGALWREERARKLRANGGDVLAERYEKAAVEMREELAAERKERLSQMIRTKAGASVTDD